MSNELELTKTMLPAELRDSILADAQEYRETLSKDDISIPFLAVLQLLSHQCVEGDADYVDGAKAGMFFNTVTGELYDGRNDGLRLLPVAYKASYIEWIPRSQGGGFVNEWSVDEGERIKTAKNENKADIIQHGSPLGTPGNQLVFTHTHYAFILKDDGSYEPVVLSLSSTQVKHSRRWNFQINSVKIPGTTTTAPRFLGMWRCTTTLNKNDSGVWFTVSFASEGFVTSIDGGAEIYAAAREFAKGVAAGERKPTYVQEPEENPTVTTDLAGDVF